MGFLFVCCFYVCVQQALDYLKPAVMAPFLLALSSLGIVHDITIFLKISPPKLKLIYSPAKIRWKILNFYLVLLRESTVMWPKTLSWHYLKPPDISCAYIALVKTVIISKQWFPKVAAHWNHLASLKHSVYCMPRPEIMI